MKICDNFSIKSVVSKVFLLTLFETLAKLAFTISVVMWLLYFLLPNISDKSIFFNISISFSIIIPFGYYHYRTLILNHTYIESDTFTILPPLIKMLIGFFAIFFLYQKDFYGEFFSLYLFFLAISGIVGIILNYEAIFSAGIIKCHNLCRSIINNSNTNIKSILFNNDNILFLSRYSHIYASIYELLTLCEFKNDYSSISNIIKNGKANRISKVSSCYLFNGTSTIYDQFKEIDLFNIDIIENREKVIKWLKAEYMAGYKKEIVDAWKDLKANKGFSIDMTLPYEPWDTLKFNKKSLYLDPLMMLIDVGQIEETDKKDKLKKV